uniref:Uncharacterized protein n=1 Tax=Arundo donax TaxID=35708 RepID=A0A0A9DLS6_ARUDO
MYRSMDMNITSDGLSCKVVLEQDRRGLFRLKDSFHGICWCKWSCKAHANQALHREVEDPSRSCTFVVCIHTS